MPFPISEFEIQKTERNLGVTFPKTFREAMMMENGRELQTAEDDWIVHPFFDASDLKRISRTSNDITSETTSAKEWEGFPSNAVAIAANGCGDILFLKPSEEDPKILEETVFVFWHEEPLIETFARSFEQMLKSES